MGKYSAAAHAAARTVETQASHCECLVPANALVREFLLEARRQRQQAAVEGTDNMAGMMKKAADSLLTYPFRVHDMASLQKIKGVGSAIARMIVSDLFSEYPPEPPSEEELEGERQQEEAMKAAQAAQRKRKKQEAAEAVAAAAAAGIQAAATGRLAATAGAAGAGAAGVVAGAPEEDEQQAGKRGMKAKKEYIPQLHSAPYAFLICMLQAQKGPAKQQHFGKKELMDLTEASGLSNKPIHGDGTSTRHTADGRKFGFDGWTSFRSSLVTKGLAYEFSNPKKVSLTQQGFALAERLYRDGVARGVLQPIPEIPTSGPMLFQVEEPQLAPAAAAAALGVPEGVAPSAALRAGNRLPVQQQQQPVLHTQQQQQRQRQQQQPWRASGQAVPALGAMRDAVYDAPGWLAAGIACTAGAGGAAAARTEEPGDLHDYHLYSLDLTARLQQQQQQRNPASARTQAAPGSSCAGALATARAAGAGAGCASPAGGGSNQEEVIDLLSDGDSPSPLRHQQHQQQHIAGTRKGTAAEAAGRAGAVAGALLTAGSAGAAGGLVGGRRAAGTAAGAPAGAAEAAAEVAAVAVPAEQVAAMVGMGYSDKKARRALRQSAGETGLFDIGHAVGLAELLDSDEDEGQEGVVMDDVMMENLGAQSWDAAIAASQQPALSQEAAEAAAPALPHRAHRRPTRGARRGASPGMPSQLGVAVGGSQPDGRASCGGGGGGSGSDLQKGARPAAPAAPAAAAAAAAALQRQESYLNQQQPQHPQQQQGGPASGAVAGGHIRMGSQQRPGFGSGSQQQLEDQGGMGAAADGAASYDADMDRFLAQVDRQLNGELDPALVPAPAPASQYIKNGNHISGGAAGGIALAAAGAPAALGVPQGLACASSSGSGGGAAPIRLRGQDVRLPPLPPGARFADEFDVLMLIDVREQMGRQNGQGVRSALEAHINTMRQAGLAVEERYLPIGDVVWIARSRRNPSCEHVLDYVVERKSVEDLYSSIVDKRYDRQKYQLSRCGLRHLYYLIEGDPDMLSAEREQKAVRTAAAKTEVMNGLVVLRTTEHHSTFRLYQRLTRQIQDLYRNLMGPSPAGQLPSFAEWVTKCKDAAEGNTTLHDVFGMMLMAVPALGENIVQAVLQKYPTPLHLYRAYQETVAAAERRGDDGHRAAEMLLQSLRCVGAKTAVGPVRSAAVYDALFRRRAAHAVGA